MRQKVSKRQRRETENNQYNQSGAISYSGTINSTKINQISSKDDSRGWTHRRAQKAAAADVERLIDGSVGILDRLYVSSLLSSSPFIPVLLK